MISAKIIKIATPLLKESRRALHYKNGAPGP